LELDVQGALAVRDKVPRALLVFVRAPSRDEQRRRLEARGTDDPDAIERRLAQAEAEEDIARERFDAVIVNDDLDRAAAELAAIVEARRQGER
jgi:guanylate kinase